jgi:hypothetical protein
MSDSSDKPMATEVPSGIKRSMASERVSNLESDNCWKTFFVINNSYRVLKINFGFYDAEKLEIRKPKFETITNYPNSNDPNKCLFETDYLL